MNKSRTATRRVGVLALLAVTALSVAACGSDEPVPELGAGVASFDLAVGTNERLLVGVSDTEGNVLAGGSVTLRMKPIPPDGSSDTGEEITATATFLPIPGRPQAAETSAPALVEPSVNLGVYRAADVTFPTAGPWEVRVDAGKAGTATAAVMVTEQHQVHLPGSPAPRTANRTISTAGVVPAALDSTISGGSIADLTDRDLHTTSVADALGAKRPVVVVASTPVYCMSRFCGPITDEVAALAPRYPDVTFVHLEVWEDFDAKKVSPFAAEWISPGGDPTANANEPWVFTVDRTGTITQRWDNVLDVAALTAEIEKISAK